MTKKVAMTDQQWKEKLTPGQYHIMRQKGTERAFTGKYYKTKDKGMYRCAACGQDLFNSQAKFDSGSGWPSFAEPSDAASIKTAQDNSLGTIRTEVKCSRCDSHLGHVFNDGPGATGLRYCVNSACLELAKEK